MPEPMPSLAVLRNRAKLIATRPGFLRVLDTDVPNLAAAVVALIDQATKERDDFVLQHGYASDLRNLLDDIAGIKTRLDALESPDAEPEPARVATTFVTQEVFDRAMRACGWAPDAEPDAALVAQMMTVASHNRIVAEYVDRANVQQARAEAAERQRDQANTAANTLRGLRHRADCDLDEARAAVEQLRVLAVYARHEDGCARIKRFGIGDCTCGFDQADALKEAHHDA